MPWHSSLQVERVSLRYGRCALQCFAVLGSEARREAPTTVELGVTSVERRVHASILIG